MTTPTIQDAHAALAAATQAPDRDARVLYIARARIIATAVGRELEMLELHLRAVEGELVRTQAAK